ncbi:MAG TPA: hypothetical protein VN881_00090, partial [Candidatus Acidoferrales bacterium]|nr:hypothetical protein [Candidatus Acidoferrales bacterium]
MKIGIWTSCLLLCVTFAVGPQAAAQDSTIQFVAKATPSSGTDEPVRGITFYLLRKSFDDIGKEAAATYPLVAMDAFIDKLDVSKELKGWMKKNHWVNLAGEEFIKKLTVDDVMNVPEFHKAYIDRMAGDQTVAFPTPKYTPALKKKNPEKYEEEVKQYQAAIRAFLVLNPKSTDGIDLSLEEVNPGHKWDAINASSVAELHRHTIDLAKSKYLVARTETDLEGQGSLRGIAPGTYWLSTLDIIALAGDARQKWDVRITVPPGKTTYVALSNINAVQ